MRLREFNINDSIVAALGVGGIVWLGIVYFEVFRRYRIRQAIFKQYPKGIIWKNRLFTVKTATDITAFNHNEIGATDVDESYPTGYGMYRFSDIDVDFVLRIPLGESDIDKCMRKVEVNDRSQWDDYITWMAETTIRFKEVFQQRVKTLDLSRSEDLMDDDE